MCIDETERYGFALHAVKVSAQRQKTIDYVSYYIDEVLADVRYGEPFFMHTETIWLEKSFTAIKKMVTV